GRHRTPPELARGARKPGRCASAGVAAAIGEPHSRGPRALGSAGLPAACAICLGTARNPPLHDVAEDEPTGRRPASSPAHGALRGGPCRAARSRADVLRALREDRADGTTRQAPTAPRLCAEFREPAVHIRLARGAAAATRGSGGLRA